MRPRLSPGAERRIALVPRAGLVAGLLCLAPVGVGTEERAAAAPQRDTAVVDPCDPTLVRTARTQWLTVGAGSAAKACTSRRSPGAEACRWRRSSSPARPFEIASGERLQVAWSQPGEAAVRLRAVALQRRVYYRMDVVRDRARTFEWPADVLVSLGLQPRDVGVVGWVERPVARDG